MAAVLPSKLIELSRATDPAEGIRKAIGPVLNEIDVFGQQVLVGTYIEAQKTAGGIWKPDSVIAESLWQNNVGLVLKLGPWAFQDDEKLGIDWKKQSVSVGDWVVFKYSDAWEFHLNGVSVRLVDDRAIRATVTNPTLLVSKPIVATA